MIKINLALRKTGSQAAAMEDVGGPRLPSMGLSADFSGFPVKQLLLSVMAVAVSTYVVGGLKSELLAELGKQEQAAQAKRTQLQGSLTKLKQYEDIKKAIDADQKLVKTKLETILKLSADRGSDFKALKLISTSIPPEVWVSSVSFSPASVSISGGALDFNQIPDFIKKLSDSDFLADVQMEDTAESRDPSGTMVASFELKAKRK